MRKKYYMTPIWIFPYNNLYPHGSISTRYVLPIWNQYGISICNPYAGSHMACIWILYMWISVVDSTWHPYAQQPMLLFIIRMLYVRLKYVEFRLHRDRRHHHN